MEKRKRGRPRKRVVLTCFTCGKSFERVKYLLRFNKSGHFFCCHKCYLKWSAEWIKEKGRIVLKRIGKFRGKIHRELNYPMRLLWRKTQEQLSKVADKWIINKLWREVLEETKEVIKLTQEQEEVAYLRGLLSEPIDYGDLTERDKELIEKYQALL